MTCDMSSNILLDADEMPREGVTRFHVYTADQLRGLPPMQWAMREILPAEGLAAIVGASGAGKSFLLLDMVAALAEAGTWFGYGVERPLQVVILVLEGEAGFRKRVTAWEEAKGRTFPKRVKFVFGTFNLLDQADRITFCTTMQLHGGADVVVIDTLNRAAPGADENSSRDASLILEGAKEMQAMLGGLVLIVHHLGKDHTKGMRGHSSLFAAMDAVIEVSRNGNRREWSVAKSKDDIDGGSHGFFLEQTPVGTNAGGDPITSCIVRPDDSAPDTRPKPPKGGNQRIVYDALAPLFRESGVYGKAEAPPTRPCLDLEAAIERVKDRLAVEPKRRRERVQQAITGMVASGVLGCSEGWIWLQ